MRICQEREANARWESERNMARLTWWIHRIGQFTSHSTWDEWIQGTGLDRHPDLPRDPGPGPGTPQEITDALRTLKAMGVPAP
jgi:hypothetical protein